MNRNARKEKLYMKLKKKLRNYSYIILEEVTLNLRLIKTLK